MVRQSIECMLIQYLLGLLKSRTHLSAGDVAHVVSALKTLAQNLNYGDQVLHILNSDPIWAEFKDQNHDLFLPNAPLRGMITGKFIIKLKKNSFFNHISHTQDPQTVAYLSPATLHKGPARSLKWL